LCPKSNKQLTEIQAKAAARAVAAYLKQSKERRRDQLQNLAKAEA
jgi:cytochrome c1